MSTRTGKLAAATGFMMHEDLAYGRINGIFLNANINYLSGETTVRAYAKRDAGVDMPGINAFLLENSKKYKKATASFDGTAVTVNIPNYMKLSVKIVADFLTDFSGFLASEGYRSSCSFCEKNDGIGYTVQEGRVMEVCPACHDRLSGILEDLKNERAQTGSYLSGASGAVLGGVIGIIPWVLIGLIGYLAAVCGAIMAFLSYKGYLLFKGRRGPGMFFIIILVLIVFTYTAVIVSQTITDYNSYPGDKSELSIFDLFGAEMSAPFSSGVITFDEYELETDTGGLWTQIVLGWLFAGIGSFVSLRNIRRESLGKDIEIARLPEK